MKTVLLLAAIILSSTAVAQIRFDISRIKKVQVKKFEVADSTKTYAFPMKYGEYILEDNKYFDTLKNAIIQKVQYIYSDYPKDFDYTELNFQRFASLYVVLPEAFNKPWIEWEIIKQTDCANAAQASKLFHGFVITIKDGPIPNTINPMNAEIKKKLESVKSNVTLTEIKEAGDLVKFLESSKVDVTNVTFPQGTSTIRLFRQEDPGALYFLNGLFLTTGQPAGAIGPNNSPSITSVNKMGPTPDKQLTQIAGKGLLFDASIVEFDVTIDADSLVFNYAFASDEYPEYLQYNDPFGLFITGPGLNGKAKDTTLNLAALPDGKTRISVSNINHLKNKDYYVPNTIENDVKLFKTWQYDGFSTVLTAKVKIKRNQKYHIKLAIADFGDPYYDSAIFIDAFAVKTAPH